MENPGNMTAYPCVENVPIVRITASLL